MTPVEHVAGDAGAYGRQRQPGPDDHVEHREPQRAVAVSQVLLEQLHRRRQDHGAQPAEAERTQQREADGGCLAHGRHHRTQEDQQGADQVQVASLDLAQDQQPASRTDPEAGDEQAELGVAASSTSFTQTMPIENNAPRPNATTAATGASLRTSGRRRASRKRPPRHHGLAGGDAQLGQPGDGQVRHHEGQRASIRKVTLARLHRRRVPVRADTSANRPAPKGSSRRGPQHQAVRDRQVVLVLDQVGDRGVPSRQEHHPRQFDHEGRCRSTTGGSSRGGSPPQVPVWRPWPASSGGDSSAWSRRAASGPARTVGASPRTSTRRQRWPSR